MGASIGYARVSSHSQELDIQLERLSELGCDKIYKETFTGTTANGREQLKAALDYVREGDTLIITKLDRLARSATDLGKISQQLQDKGVDLKVLDQSIDTTTPQGKLMFTMIGAFAEFERDLIWERCQEGIAKAKERGVRFGRRSKLTAKQLESMKAEFAAGDIGKVDLARRYGISRASLYRLVKSTGGV